MTTRTRKVRAKALGKLTPTAFENLVFDLLISRGMVNVVWRTPGADGGRDIEAATVVTDFSGTQSLVKWFIECKRYAGSVDWPTIYGKLSYAESHQADFLLLCTTAKFTPSAINQVENWNLARRGPKIRLWPLQELENQLKLEPDILMKYGLSVGSDVPGSSIVSLALTLSKSVGSVYSQAVFEGSRPPLMLQAAQSMAELLLRRMEDLAEARGIRPVFDSIDTSSLDDLRVSAPVRSVDELGLRALASYIIALTREPVSVTGTGRGMCTLSSTVEISSVLTRYRDAFSAIALWSDFEFSFDSHNIFLRQRL